MTAAALPGAARPLVLSDLLPCAARPLVLSDLLPCAARPLVLSDLLPGALVRDAALVLGGAALVGLAAQVSTPLPGTRCRPASPPMTPPSRSSARWSARWSSPSPCR